MMFKLAILWLHILSIVAWIGGWLFLLILWLASKGDIRSGEALQLTRHLTWSARFMASRGLELLILTGIFNFLIRMVQGSLSPGYHLILGMKLILVGTALVLQLVEGRVSRRREALLAKGGEGLKPSPPELLDPFLALLRRSTLLAVVNLAIGLFIILLGLLLSRM
ncbi:MAG: hypothetical protein ACK4Z6_01345 [Candidatus Methylomirabilales bacterium]